jgi:hypothetical protein
MHPSWPVPLHPSWTFPQRRTAQSPKFEGNTSWAAAKPDPTFGKNVKNLNRVRGQARRMRIRPQLLRALGLPLAAAAPKRIRSQHP